MTPITIDFETFWSKDFSLTKINFIEYINSPEFEIISVSVKVGEGQTRVYFGQDTVIEELQKLDWSDALAIAHNGNEFDFPILVWKCGCHPKFFADTICMSRPIHQSEAGGSLAKLSEFYSLKRKDSTVLMETKGKRYIDFTLEEMARMSTYNRDDTDNAYDLFKIFLKSTSKEEMWLSDMTARAICYPQLEADIPLLEETLVKVAQEKEATLAALTVTLNVLTTEEVRAELASSAKFGEVLRLFGVEPPTKISKTTGKEILALAKTDEEFVELMEHENPTVQALCGARLGVRSTLLETRLTRMIACAKAMGGAMPVPLAYHSATTGRWGGRVWNPQNMTRIPRDKQGRIIPKLTNSMRMSLRAPKRKKVVVCDSSGIELRVNHYLWQVPSTEELYVADPEADLYKTFAAMLYGIEVKDVTKEQRQLAKVAQLGLGFGAGYKTFRKVAKMMGGIDLDEAESERVTNAWRVAYIEIVRGWKRCQDAVKWMHTGQHQDVDPRGLVTTGTQRLRLPSGRILHYPNLHTETSQNEWNTTKSKQEYWYGLGKNRSKVYAGLLDENIVQAIARDVVAYQAKKIFSATGKRPVHTVHDELVYVVPDAEDPVAFLATINHLMRQAPPWLPGIILWSEGDVGQTYGECK